jgi:hypothetical protein
MREDLKRLNMTKIEKKLDELKTTTSLLRVAEADVSNFRDDKWELVEELKAMGHDFTATTEGMDVVLSAPPSMRWN